MNNGATITLLSSDYDELEVYSSYGMSYKFQKGVDLNIFHYWSNESQMFLGYRPIARTNDTTFICGQCYHHRFNKMSATTDTTFASAGTHIYMNPNESLMPMKIVGIKYNS